MQSSLAWDRHGTDPKTLRRCEPERMLRSINQPFALKCDPGSKIRACDLAAKSPFDLQEAQHVFIAHLTGTQEFIEFNNLFLHIGWECFTSF